MGEAKRRGSFEVRKAEAVKAGRTPEIRKQLKLERQGEVRKLIQEYLLKALLRARPIQADK